jgi:hypothetical protein
MNRDDILAIGVPLVLIGYGVMATMGFERVKGELKEFKEKALQLGYAEIVLPDKATEDSKPVFSMDYK